MLDESGPKGAMIIETIPPGRIQSFANTWIASSITCAACLPSKILPEFIQTLYAKRFGRDWPAEVRSIEEMTKAKSEKKGGR